MATNTAVLIVAGEAPGLERAREVALDAKLVVAADRGAEYALAWGLRCDAIVGDLDSIAKETLEYFDAMGTEIVRMIDQDRNDFEKSLAWLLLRFTGEVRILGMTGRRTDHTLANFSVMLRYADEFERLVAFEETAEHWFLTEARSDCEIECPTKTTISLTPFGIAEGITTENLRYLLDRNTLEFGIREGLSNVSIGNPVRISIERGALLVSRILR